MRVVALPNIRRSIRISNPHIAWTQPTRDVLIISASTPWTNLSFFHTYRDVHDKLHNTLRTCRTQPLIYNADIFF